MTGDLQSSLHTKQMTDTHTGYKQYSIESRKKVFHMMLRLALICDRSFGLKNMLVALLADRPPVFLKA